MTTVEMSPEQFYRVLARWWWNGYEQCRAEREQSCNVDRAVSYLLRQFCR